MKLTKGGTLERPNLCTICERTPGVGERVVDTEKYFDGFPVNLQGRRYVCERCATEMFKFFDYATQEEVWLARREEAQAKAILRGLKFRLDELSNDLRRIAENPQALTEVGDPDLSQITTSGVRSSANNGTTKVVFLKKSETSGDQSTEDGTPESGSTESED